MARWVARPVPPAGQRRDRRGLAGQRARSGTAPAPGPAPGSWAVRSA